MARKNIGAKPYITPMPVLMLSSYDDGGKPCAMLAVWGGISNEKEITIKSEFVDAPLIDELPFAPFAYDWMNKAYFSIGPKVGTAYRDGLALK